MINAQEWLDRSIHEQLEQQSQTYLKELESAKFHEQRGKIKCECYQCQESKQIQGKIKKELFIYFFFVMFSLSPGFDRIRKFIWLFFY